MFGKHFGSIRWQLVLWYLSVLAVVLLGLGVFQYITLSQYLRSSMADSIRHAAYGELRVLGPCFIRSRADLDRHALSLAQLLGSRQTATKIVTASGQTLANHNFDTLPRPQPLNLSPATIRQLIDSTRSTMAVHAAAGVQPTCRSVSAVRDVARAATRPATSDHSLVIQGDLVLVAVPLGSARHPVGYAFLGQSFAEADATVRRTAIVFSLAAVVALVLAAFVALPMINRALRPLRRIAVTAGAIAAGDLGQRANLTYSPDEIGRLGRAFDAMVDRLQAALTEAQESEEGMRRFLADASHELRTPLTVLRGTSEVLLRQGIQERPEMVQGLRDMQEEAVRLSKLVDDLLTLSRLDTGDTLAPESVPVRPFLEQFADRYATAWPNRHISLDLEALNGARVLMDPDALRRVVINLVDNAARYSTSGEPITVGGVAGSDQVTVSIRDRGPGLSQEDARRAFERFYRGSKSRSRQSGGSGLGLAIVQALVEQSGGRVDIDTAPDHGTTVRVTLPIDSTR